MFEDECKLQDINTLKWVEKFNILKLAFAKALFDTGRMPAKMR